MLQPAGEFQEALARELRGYGLTANGELLRRKLHSVLTAIPPRQESSALHENLGARILAHELLAMLEAGLDGPEVTYPVRTAARGPVGARRARGARRRVAFGIIAGPGGTEPERTG